jgi:dihydroxyacetone kinase
MSSPEVASMVVQRWLALALETIAAHEDELGRLDAAAGDGDHGTTMVRGLRAAVAAADKADGSAGQLLAEAGAAFADAAGGASGALVGALLSTTGRTLGDGPYDAPAVVKALQAGLSMVMRLGKAHPGDKTLIDALQPFVDALAAQPPDQPLAAAWMSALPAAHQGAEATSAMVARRGRSAKLGERSLGHPDPGAISIVYLLQATGDVLNAECNASTPPQ